MNSEKTIWKYMFNDVLDFRKIHTILAKMQLLYYMRFHVFWNGNHTALTNIFEIGIKLTTKSVGQFNCFDVDLKEKMKNRCFSVVQDFCALLVLVRECFSSCRLYNFNTSFTNIQLIRHFKMNWRWNMLPQTIASVTSGWYRYSQ